MIEFSRLPPELKLLNQAVNLARKTKWHIISLSDLAPKRDIISLTELGREWQKAGLGFMIEESNEGQRSVSFSLNDKAVSVVAEVHKRSLFGWLRSVTRSDWIALGAFIVSVIALFKC